MDQSVAPNSVRSTKSDLTPPDGDVDEKTARRVRDAMVTATALAPGDLVIHAEHGLGRFEKLTTLAATGAAARDVFEIAYREGKLLVPIEELGLLSRFGHGGFGCRLRPVGQQGLAAAQGKGHQAHRRRSPPVTRHCRSAHHGRRARPEGSQKRLRTVLRRLPVRVDAGSGRCHRRLRR